MGGVAKGGDAATLDFYTREATAYADYADGEKRSRQLSRFLSLLPEGGRALDFGCGPGWAGGRMLAEGFVAEGFDGSEGLAEEARKRYGLPVAVGRFEEFGADTPYDGIWASFCLLHDTREAMPGHLARLAAALIPGGVIYIGLKAGEGAHRDDLGRMYTYFSEPEMRGLLTEAGFTNIDAESEASTGYDGKPAVSLHIFARRG